MDWVPLTDYRNTIDYNDAPRTLTSEEIDYITKHLPISHAADADSANLARQGVIKWLKEVLEAEKFAPSSIPEIIEAIVTQHNKSLIAPGTPAGITAAEAVGATNTQMTLNSVAPWERVLIQDIMGNAHLLKIGDWVDSLLSRDPSKIQHIPENRTQYLELPYPVNIASPDENGKVSWERVTAVTKHLPVGDMVKIVTRSGREVTVTQSKSLLVWNNKKLIQTDGKSVKVGDRVPVFVQIPDPPVVVNEIDLSTFLSPKERIHESEHTLLYKGYKEYNIPEKIPLTKEFGQIVGIYLAEGLCTDTYLGFSNNDDGIQNSIYKWCDSYGIKYHTKITNSTRGKSTDIYVYSIFLAKFFMKWLETGGTNKIIPHEVLLGNKDFIIGVLDGYFACDGTINKRNGHLTISSASKDLITGFGFLCSRLGIFGKQSGHQPKSNNIGSKNIRYVNTYSIRNKNAIIWNKIIGSCHFGKRELMENLEFVQKGNTERGIYYQKHNDVMLDPIVSIELVSPTEYVYDLTVPTTTNFSLWNGLGIADTFHFSGTQKSASFGIDSMRDLIFAREKPKNESCTIYFTDKTASYEEVLNSRRYIVGSVVSDFVRDYDIDAPENLRKYWWHEGILLNKKVPKSTKVLRLFLNIPEMFKHKVSIRDLAQILENEVPPSVVTIYGPVSDGIIDLYPHPGFISETLKEKEKAAIPGELAELTFLESIVLKELDNIRVKGIAGIRKLIPVVSPVWRIVSWDRKMTIGDTKDDKTREMLQPYIDSGSTWILFCNVNTMKNTGIMYENLAALCKLGGIIPLGIQDNFMVVSMPNDRFRTSGGEVVVEIDRKKYRKLSSKLVTRYEDHYYRNIDDITRIKGPNREEQIEDDIWIIVPIENVELIGGKLYRKIPDERYLELDGVPYEEIVDQRVKIREMTPNEYITSKINADSQARKEEIKRITETVLRESQNLSEEERRAYIRRPVNVPYTPLMVASEFVIAETEGSNLKELLALPGIDKTRTTCNNMHTVASVLGIEASRSFIMEALNNTIANTGSYVHPTNIMFICEFITNRGEPHGATYMGISRQQNGHLSLATIERAGSVFTKNALHGRKEDIRNVSASVAVGSRMAIGDGYFDIAQDITENGVAKTLINDDLFTGFKRDDATKRLGAIRDAESKMITTEDIMSGTDDLKTINIGTFDYTAAEDQTNLLELFSQENIQTREGITNIAQGLPVQKNVRRVQAHPVSVTGVETSTIDIPRGFVDILDQIKIGVPLPETGEIAAIKPLETGVTRPMVPVLSSGLVELPKLVTSPVETGIPGGLVELMERYRTEIEGKEIGARTIVTELPKVEVPKITGLNVGRMTTEYHQEQVRGLKLAEKKTQSTNQ